MGTLKMGSRTFLFDRRLSGYATHYGMEKVNNTVEKVEDKKIILYPSHWNL